MSLVKATTVSHYQKKKPRLILLFKDFNLYLNMEFFIILQYNKKFYEEKRQNTMKRLMASVST